MNKLACPNWVAYLKANLTLASRSASDSATQIRCNQHGPSRLEVVCTEFGTQSWSCRNWPGLGWTTPETLPTFLDVLAIEVERNVAGEQGIDIFGKRSTRGWACKTVVRRFRITLVSQ